MNKLRQYHRAPAWPEGLERRLALAVDVAVLAFDAPLELNNVGAEGAIVKSVTAADLDGSGRLDLIVTGLTPKNSPTPDVTGETSEVSTIELSEDSEGREDLLADAPADSQEDDIQEGETPSPLTPEPSLTPPTGEQSGGASTDPASPPPDPSPMEPATATMLPFASVYLNFGAGDTATVLELPIDDFQAEFRSQSVADINGDGLLDVVAQATSGQVTIWLSSRTEQSGSPLRFEQPTVFRLEGRLLSLIDMNGDGLADFQTRHNDELLIFMQESTEAIQLTAAARHSGGKNPMVFADIDGDDDPDLVSACLRECSSPQLVARLNNGTGQLGDTSPWGAIEVGARLTQLQSADLNGDGFADIVASNELVNGSSLEIWRGSVDGAQSMAARTIPSDLRNFRLADINADDVPDIVAHHEEVQHGHARSNLTAYVAKTDSEFSYDGYTLPSLAGELLAVEGSEITSFDSDTERIHAVRASAESSFAASYSQYEIELDGRSAEILDLNGDNRQDVVGKSARGIEFALRQEDGSFVTTTIELTDMTSYQFYVDEFDVHEGKDVTIVGTANDGGTTVLRVEVGADRVEVADRFETDAGIVLEVVDLDADGLTDFVFRSDFFTGATRSFVLLNRENTWRQTTLSDESATVAVEDLDGDGTLEAYVFDNPIHIFKFQGDTFVPWGEIPKGTTRARVLDMNSDGLSDFISINKKSNEGTTLSVFINGGDGTWLPRTPIEASSHELLDIDGDGNIDIASPRHFFLFEPSGIWAKTDILASTTPEWAERNQYIDLNNDGVIDNAKLHATSGRLTIHELNSDLSWTVHEFNTLTGFNFELLDLNGDGLHDIMDANGADLHYALRDDSGWGRTQVLADGVQDYLTVDRNGDGLLDIVALRGSHIVYFLQDESGKFVQGSDFDTGPFTLRDVNDDGFLDLDLAGSTQVMLGSAQGFSAPTQLAASPPVTAWLGSLLQFVDDEADSVPFQYYATPLLAPPIDANGYRHSIADLDGDGDTDLLALFPNGMLILNGTVAEDTTEPAEPTEPHEPEPPLVIEGDFDGDGELGVTDIDLLHAAIRVAHGSASGDWSEEHALLDLNADGALDNSDALYWIEELAETALGDSDLDGDVDFADFLAFSLHFGDANASWSDGDFDGDGSVTFPDFIALTREFGGRDTPLAEDTAEEDGQNSGKRTDDVLSPTNNSDDMPRPTTGDEEQPGTIVDVQNVTTPENTKSNDPVPAGELDRNPNVSVAPDR